ncbi:surface protease GP63 [Trypanosoma cruzi]|nr:surface protease GP63 [Trypanosoma cruzi]
MSEYFHMLRELGVFCQTQRVRSLFQRLVFGSIHEMSAKRPMGRCPITDPALDVGDVDAVIWRGEYFSAVPGDEPSSWCPDTLPNTTMDARDPKETHLSAATHAALRCLGMQLHLEVTEKGNVRCAPCTDGATIAWTTRPYDDGNGICRDHAQVCTISANSGRLLPVVPWDGEERACGAGRSHRHLLNFCQGHPSPMQRALGPAAAHHRRMLSRLFPRSIRRQRRSGSGQDAPTDRKKLLSAAGTEAARRKACRPRLRLSVMTLLLLVPVRCFFCLPLLPPWQHSIELRCGRRCAARRLRFLLRGLYSSLDAQ